MTGARGLFQFMPPGPPDPARARVADDLDRRVHAVLEAYARRRYAQTQWWRTPLEAADPAQCPDRPDPADETPHMRYASADVDPRVTLLGGVMPMRSVPAMPPGLAIVRAETPADLDVGGALEGVVWRDVEHDPLPRTSVQDMIKILKDARRAMEEHPYRPYEPLIISPAAYADGVARGLLPPRSTAIITTVDPEDT